MIAHRFNALFVTAALLVPAASAQPHAAADLGRRIISAGLDPAECYRIRDIEITEDEARIYLTDGYLMFGKPVNGAPLTAVFSADTDGGDAEVLLLPPDRSERKSMASYTGTPNLNEHFGQAAFIFTDSTAQSLLEQVRSSGAKKFPDIGAVMVERWSSVVANLLTGFESRVVLDLLTPGVRKGFFEAVIQGRNLGNFDVIYDARAYEQLVAGQVTTRNGGTWWDTWTSFVSRSHRGLQPPRPEEEILSYKIEATLDPTLNMHCVTRLRIRAREESTNVLALDLSGRMRAVSAKIDGVPVEVYERESLRTGLVQNTGNELLLLLPPRPLQPGSEHEIEIEHEGKVIIEAGHQVYFVSARGAWYPNRGLQFAKFDVTYRYPKTLNLVASGQVKEDRVEGDVRITRRVPDGPVRFLGFNLGQYECRELERGGITAEVCANKQLEDALRPRIPEPPQPTVDISRTRRRVGPTGVQETMTPLVPNPVNQLTRIAARVDTATDFYRSKFGDPPIRRIEVSPVPGRFGQGFSGLIYLPTVNYLDASAPVGNLPAKDQLFFRDLLLAHEVAHQWWGNIVTSASYHNEWLMEALANYSAIMYLETQVGPKAIETALELYRKQLFIKGPDGETAEAEGPVVQGRRLESSNNPSASFVVLYGKGTWIIHMLRRRLGDERFLKMLAELRRRYEWKAVDNEQFRALCVEFLPKGAPDAKLESFFDQWVYGTGVPTLKLAFSVRAGKLTGTVTQSDVPEDFSISVPVEVQTARGKTMVKMVWTSSDPVQFTVPVISPTAKAVLDPGLSVLHR
ncbi:MAG: hypothetical protein QOJ99_2458 [Bryobacterales bacterium]|nr:hypothetical protein [Bryobacterales bacterium]